MAIFLFSLAGIIAVLVLLNFVSYRLFGARIRNRREKWDLNICCGRTDGGGVNADIVKHAEVPNYVQVEDIYDLPFRTGQFENVLCSHTLEHVEDPEAFFEELSRVAKEVTIVLPPLWDLSAVLNVFEHKWIFFSFRKEHRTLPRHIKLPFAWPLQKKLGQRIKA